MDGEGGGGALWQLVDGALKVLFTSVRRSGDRPIPNISLIYPSPFLFLFFLQQYDPPPLGPAAIAALLAQKTGIPPPPGLLPGGPPLPAAAEPVAPVAEPPQPGMGWP